jgi:hypothetical protein
VKKRNENVALMIVICCLPEHKAAAVVFGPTDWCSQVTQRTADVDALQRSEGDGLLNICSKIHFGERNGWSENNGGRFVFRQQQIILEHRSVFSAYSGSHVRYVYACMESICAY